MRKPNSTLDTKPEETHSDDRYVPDDDFRFLLVKLHNFVEYNGDIDPLRSTNKNHN